MHDFASLSYPVSKKMSTYLFETSQQINTTIAYSVLNVFFFHLHNLTDSFISQLYLTVQGLLEFVETWNVPEKESLSVQP